jgi:hypothetical protein
MLYAEEFQYITYFLFLHYLARLVLSPLCVCLCVRVCVCGA